MSDPTQRNPSRRSSRNQNIEISRSQLARIMAVFLAVVVWFVLYGHFAKTMEVESTRLILQSSGCAYLQLQHIPTQPFAISNTCAAEVNFRRDMFGHGGTIHAGDGTLIQLADNQIVAVVVLADQPWTPEQIRAARWSGLYTTALLIVWLIWLAMRRR